jgi:hypothetical protein
LNSGRGAAITLPTTAKAAIQTEAARFVHEHMRVEAPRAGHKFNPISSYSVKWRGPYLLFTATYTCPGPNARPLRFQARAKRASEREKPPVSPRRGGRSPTGGAPLPRFG